MTEEETEVMAVICEVYAESLEKIAVNLRQGKETLALAEWQKMKRFQQPLGRLDDLMKSHFKL